MIIGVLDKYTSYGQLTLAKYTSRGNVANIYNLWGGMCDWLFFVGKFVKLNGIELSSMFYESVIKILLDSHNFFDKCTQT